MQQLIVSSVCGLLVCALVFWTKDVQNLGIIQNSVNMFWVCVSLIQNNLFVNLESYKVGFVFVSLGAFKQKS